MRSKVINAGIVVVCSICLTFALFSQVKVLNNSGTVEVKSGSNLAPFRALSVEAGGSMAGEVQLYELPVNGSNYRAWVAPDSLTATLKFKFSDAVPTEGQTFVLGAPDGNNISAVTFGSGSGSATAFDFTKHYDYMFVYEDSAGNKQVGSWAGSANWAVFGAGASSLGDRSTDSAFYMYQQLTANATGTKAGSFTAFASQRFKRAANTRMHVRFKPVTSTLARYVVGFSGCGVATNLGADSPEWCNSAYFLASTTTGNHNWYVFTGNSLQTGTLTDTAVAWAADTAYELDILLGDSVVTWKVNSTTGTISSTLPQAADYMWGGYIAVGQTSGTADTSCRFDRIVVQQDN